MKHLTLKILSFVAVLGLGFACSSPTSNNKETESSETEAPMEDPVVVTLTKAPASPDFPDATLTKSDLSVEASDSLFSIEYSFSVENYELGAQTADAATRGIANSGKGQHIHFIVNNGPYSAHYMPGVNNKLEAGNYVVLAFLSRSYHESVKSEGAFHIENLKVGDVEENAADLTAPHLFYSRPKGTYKGADTEKLMLDFYLLNTSISPDGNKVKASINGDEFLIDEWKPMYIEGLPMGEVTIKLELIDAEGNLIEGPFNSVERIVTLVAE